MAAKQEYVAIKTFSMQGLEYNAGDKVDVRGLTPQKLHQLCDQRWIRPIQS